MLIKFKLKLIIQNLVNGEIYDFSKIVTRKNVDLEVGVPREIEKKDITTYFKYNISKYCENNNITEEQLLVDGYEVESRTEYVHVYFKTEDMQTFTLSPSIMAYRKEVTNIVPLNCEQIDNTTVKWFWDHHDEYAYILIDDKNNTISHLPVNVNYFLETNLKPGETYTRRLLSYDGTDFNSESLECSITLIENKKPAIFQKFTVEKRDESITPLDTNYADRLDAFASGVGDNLDCKLFKPDDITYSKKFKLLNKIYGVRASKEVKHHTIKFFYRYKMTGIVDYPTYEGYAKVLLKARKITGSSLGPVVIGERELHYTFNEKNQVADIYFFDLMPSLDKNFASKYEFEITISDIKGNMTVYSYTHGYANEVNADSSTINFKENGYFNHKISIAAIPVIRQKEYSEIYPPTNFEPLVGAINGDFEVNPSGKKDMIDHAPIFSIPPSVYDLKYYCIIEKVSPKDAYVKFKFDGKVNEDGYTNRNGDRILFSSNAIIEDPTEYYDFLAQIEEGEFNISDSRKHKYKYKIENLSVSADKYKRFELVVTPTINDITILDYGKVLNVKDGLIDSNVEVTVRAVQSAIAKWEPLVHNGYYYYNQDEYFMYTNCIMDGDGKKIEDVYYNPMISAKIHIEATEPIGPVENYSFTKNTKDDLLLNEKLFSWERNMIVPRPYNIPNDYYFDFYEEYEYFSEPFIFNKVPTSFDSIDWDFVCNVPNSMKVYAVTYNNVYGEWNAPVEIFKGQPLPDSIKLSQILVIKALMKPSRRPKLETRELIFSSEYDWNESYDKFLSVNVNYKEEGLKPKSYYTEGIYISKTIDLGDTASSIKARSVCPNLSYYGDVTFYIQESDTKDGLFEKLKADSWVKINNKTTKTNVKRFYRFKIVVKPKSRLHSMNLKVTRYEYTNMDLFDYVPAISNIKVEAKYDPQLSIKMYEYILASNLFFDQEPHPITNNFKKLVQNMATAQGFLMNNIVKYSIKPYGNLKESFNIIYDSSNILEEPIYAQSLEVVYDNELIEKHQKGVIFDVKNNSIIVNPIPQQYSPIIIHKITDDIEAKNPMTNVFFIGNDGSFILENIEEFESLGFKTLYLQYINLDETSLKIEINGQEVTNYDIINNIIEFDNEVEKGSTVKVSYKIKDSYCVNYDYKNDRAIVNFNGNTNKEHIGKVRVYYETNKATALRKLHNICLNPIYNVAYNGYIYICDYTLEPYKLSVYPASDFIYANGKDEMNVVIQVTDRNGNPLENIDVNVKCEFGKIEKINNKTDANGVLACMYTSSTIGSKDVIVAAASTIAKGKAVIVNRKL